MRNSKGKLIAVWVPGNHGAGGSTVANSVGIALQHLASKSTLLVNMGSSKNFLEQYMSNDIDIRFTMDHLKSFGDNLTAEHIKIYSASINDELYILPNCKLSKDLCNAGEDFNHRLLDLALSVFDIVVVDMEAGWTGGNKQLFNKADLILAVMNENAIMLEELLSGHEAVKSILSSSKTIALLNGLYNSKDAAKLLSRLSGKLGIGEAFGLSFDISASRAACSDGRFYSYLKRELCKKRSLPSLPEEIRELCYVILDKLYIQAEESSDKASLISLIFAKAKQWREVDV